jgi:hypothetical protein
MAGLLYLKHTFALSDEELIARWVENAYWQSFCGETYFQHAPPIHPTSLTRYRQRLGASGCGELLQVTIEAGVAERVIEERDMAEVLCPAGQNLRLILRAIEAFFARYILACRSSLCGMQRHRDSGVWIRSNVMER